MANNPYVNKVIYGNDTVMDISDTTAVESDVASGKYFYKANGEKVSGSAVSPTITDITPSNASPVSLTADVAVKPTTSGVAIASYSSVTPSDASPVTLTSGDIVKLGGNGKAVANVNSITPSASAPSMSSGSIYKAGGSGYAIDTYSSITPSTSGAYFASGFRKMSSSGYAYSNQQTVKLAYSGSPISSIAKYGGAYSFTISDMTTLVAAVIGVKWGSYYTMYADDSTIESGEYRCYYFNGTSWVKSSSLRFTKSGTTITIKNYDTSYTMTVSYRIYYK